jgi:thiol:disulfide interchange protein
MTDQPQRGDSGPTSQDVTTRPVGGPCCPLAGGGSRSWVLWAILLILVALVYFNSRRTASVASAVPWEKNLQTALDKARQSHRPILLKFHAVWCGPCQAMEREVYTRKDVADALANWIAVSIDGDQEPQIMNHYNVEAFPTLVMLDAAGKEIFRYEGYMEAEQLIRTIRSLDKPRKPATQAT